MSEDPAPDMTIEIRSIAEELAFPTEATDIPGLTDRYLSLVNAYLEENLAEYAREYQGAINSLEASKAYLTNLDTVLDSIRTTRERNEKMVWEVIGNIIEGLKLDEERSEEIRRFLTTIPGIVAKVTVAEAIALAYGANE